MTHQTSSPLRHHSLSASNRSAREVTRIVSDGDLSPAYQRGSVWTNEQRIALIKSWLIGLPIPAVIINDRFEGPWPTRRDGLPMGGHFSAVIDGKQRIETATMWFDGKLPVPATWFPADQVRETTLTSDGDYVTFLGLTTVARRYFVNRALLPVIETHVGSVEEEAELYLLINGQGTAQGNDDMDRAAKVAKR